MLIHAYPDKKASIRVHLSNSLNSLEGIIKKGSIRFKEFIRSEKVDSYKPLYLAQDLIEDAIGRSFYCQPDLASYGIEERRKLEHTNCIKFALALSKHFEISIDD